MLNEIYLYSIQTQFVTSPVQIKNYVEFAIIPLVTMNFETDWFEYSRSRKN